MLCLGHSRRVFTVAEIGPWNAEDVVKGAFHQTSAPGHVHDFTSRIHPILARCLDPAGYHTIRERGHHQAMAGTLRIHHPPRHRDLPSGAYRLKQGGQEAFALTHSPRLPTPNRCTVCTHPASAHHHPSESVLDSAFAHLEPDRQSSIHTVHSVPSNPHHGHVFEDEPSLGAYRVLLSGRANASMGTLHLPI
jgi:hypothetical protein